MTKVVLALYEPEKREREARGHAVRGLSQAWLDRSERLTICVADEHARMKSPSPFPLSGPRPVALVDTWPDDPQAVIAVGRSAGFEVHAWPADEPIPTDYGDNAHAAPRDWPDGERSPGVSLISLLPRPARLDRETWVQRWHGVMSPVSTEIQPRTRYVRNLLGPALTEGAPDIEGAVNECWPSQRHVSSPWLFYGAENPWQLARNGSVILRSVMHCFPLTRIVAVPMSEYLVRS